MKSKQRLFIYDRKEMVVLVLIILVGSLFTFTLGVHLGKRVSPRGYTTPNADTPLVGSVGDVVPNRQELDDKAKGTPDNLQATLGNELHEEVTRLALRLDSPKQVELPEEPVTKNAGATTLENRPERRSAGISKYTLQIGSFPTKDEARRELSKLEKSDLKAYLREADLKSKGKWYRLYVGGFATRSSAEEVGERYKSEHKIASFIVSKVPN